MSDVSDGLLPGIPGIPTHVRPDPGVYIIKNKRTGTNITLKGGEGTTLTAWAQSTDTDQQWQISHLGNGQYSIINNANGYLISSVKGGGQVATAQFLPPNEIDIRWVFLAVGDGNLYIQKPINTYVLDLAESRTDDGTPILVYERHPLPAIDNQIWALIPV